VAPDAGNIESTKETESVTTATKTRIQGARKVQAKNTRPYWEYTDAIANAANDARVNGITEREAMRSARLGFMGIGVREDLKAK